MTPSREVSPQFYARLAGALYLVIIAAGIAGELLVRGPLLVSGDAAATARHIREATDLWRMGIAGDLLMHLCDLPVMWALYILLRTVNPNLAKLNLLFNVIQTAVLVVNKLNLVIVTLLLGNSAALQALDLAQRESWAYLFIQLHEHGFGIGLIFFGVVCLMEGYLIIRSGFLPKILGYGMLTAGICYLTNSLALLLAPGIASALFPFILLPPFVAELSLALWLLIKGVDEARWKLGVA